ncbi:galactose-4-epimerase, UDP, isoform CRA_c [Rattus norvegicus]|uniref:Galactose-4-epimerase, UDP, isoform CRA_c n=1 Tax=Rattus norvegicus TaxID=10116 RepID=A6IT85_RAT|nr:galactose-4-epimerase, UDP, isoform CRA_c [Rattus norvegicus]
MWRPVMPTLAWPMRSWAGQQPWGWTGCVKICGAGRSRTLQALGRRPEALLTTDQKRAATCFAAATGPYTLMR